MKTQITPAVNPPCAYCGVDIAKATFTAAMATDEPKDAVTFPNTPAGFDALQAWLEARAACGARVRLVMEATGAYWVPLALRLHGNANLVVCVVNPTLAKAFARSFGGRAKTDAIDASILALFARDRASEAWVPPTSSRAKLRDLARCHDDLTQALHAFRARAEQSLCTESAKIFRATVRSMETQLEKTRAAMKSVVAADTTLKARADLLETVPGIAGLSAMQILAELPENLVGDGRVLSAYAGVVPQLSQSGTSVNRSALCRSGNPALRRRLYLAAVVAGTWCPELKAFKERLVVKGKSPKTDLLAVAHKLMRIINIMLVTNTAFDPQKLRPTA